MALEHRWSKCITLEGKYIEKEEVALLAGNKLAGYSLTRPRTMHICILLQVSKSSVK